PRVIPFACSATPETALPLGVALRLWLSVRRRHRVLRPSATPTHTTRTQPRRRRGMLISGPNPELVRRAVAARPSKQLNSAAGARSLKITPSGCSESAALGPRHDCGARKNRDQYQSSDRVRIRCAEAPGIR